MKAKVLRSFRDKATKKLYKTGDTFDGNKERVEEINSAGKDRPYLQVKEGKEGA